MNRLLGVMGVILWNAPPGLSGAEESILASQVDDDVLVLVTLGSRVDDARRGRRPGWLPPAGGMTEV